MLSVCVSIWPVDFHFPTTHKYKGILQASYHFFIISTVLCEKFDILNMLNVINTLNVNTYFKSRLFRSNLNYSHNCIQEENMYTCKYALDQTACTKYWKLIWKDVPFKNVHEQFQLSLTIRREVQLLVKGQGFQQNTHTTCTV